MLCIANGTRRTTVLASALVMLLVLAMPSAALADTEPNNGLLQAEGPLAGGTWYSGQVVSDDDWYAFYVSGQIELDISATLPAEAQCFSPYLYLIPGEGGDSVGSTSLEENAIAHVRYTTPPGTNRFYLRITGCEGDSYRFRIDPASAITTGPRPAPAIPTGEPNESVRQAIGPLLGGIDYSGLIGTQNDEDWFYFYAFGSQPLSIEVTSVTGCGSFALYDGSGKNSLAGADASADTLNYIRYTTRRGAQRRYNLRADCSQGGDYRFRIDPRAAVTTVPRRVVLCGRAQTSRSKYAKRVKKLKRKLRRAHRKTTHRRYLRQLKSAKRNLKKARDNVNRYCL